MRRVRSVNTASADASGARSRRQAFSSALTVSSSCASARKASMNASRPAPGVAARSHAIACAAARVVDKVQPVSSSAATPARSSKARMRRTTRRSCAISATLAAPPSKASSTASVAALASSSRPAAHRRRGDGSAAASSNGRAGSLSASRCSVGTAPPNGMQPCPPAPSSTQAETGIAYSRSVAGASADAAHSMAKRANRRSLAPGPLAAGRACRKASHHAARASGRCNALASRKRMGRGDEGLDRSAKGPRVALGPRRAEGLAAQQGRRDEPIGGTLATQHAGR